MLTWLLIALVIGLALAPLMHFVPSKRQRQLAGLREFAAVHGLFVEFRRLPGSTGESPAAIAPVGNIIYYGKRLRQTRREPLQPGGWIRHEDGWRSLKRRLPLPGSLDSLPEGVVAASVDNGSCGVYWDEAAGREGAEQILRALEEWAVSLDA